jgi:hypothetical protein
VLNALFARLEFRFGFGSPSELTDSSDVFRTEPLLKPLGLLFLLGEKPCRKCKSTREHATPARPERVGQHELVVAHERLGVLEVLLVNPEGYPSSTEPPHKDASFQSHFTYRTPSANMTERSGPTEKAEGRFARQC